MTAQTTWPFASTLLALMLLASPATAQDSIGIEQVPDSPSTDGRDAPESVPATATDEPATGLAERSPVPAADQSSLNTASTALIDEPRAAASVVVPPAPLAGAGSFLAVILTGLFLALGLQLLLTQFSIAAGISMIGPIDEKSKDSKRNGSTSSQNGANGSSFEEQIHGVTNRFGFWSTITTSLSLFLAAWAAISLGFTVDVVAGALLGLTIWSLSYLVLFVLEAAAVSTMVGSISRFALDGVRGAYQSAASLFEKSTEQRAADIASSITDAITDELASDNAFANLRREFRQYVEQLEPQRIEPGRIRREFLKLFDDLEVHAIAARDANEPFEFERVVAQLRDDGKITAEDAEAVEQGLSSGLNRIRREAQSDKSTEEQVLDAAQGLAGQSKQDAEKTRHRFEDYLRDTDKEELHPEAIKSDLRALVTRPKAGVQAIQSRLEQFDRSTVVALLAERDDFDQQEAEQLVGQIEQTTSELLNELTDQKEQTKQFSHEQLEQAKIQIESKARNYLNSLDRPELNYDAIRHDLELLFDDPESGADALVKRFKAMDRETLEAIIASARSDWDEQDAERFLDEAESIRDEALTKARRLKNKVRRKLKAARDEALHAAEEARVVAASAAWWAFGTAVLSATAALVGGILGAMFNADLSNSL